MAEPQLRLVDTTTGALAGPDDCPTCAEWAKKYHGALSQLGLLRAELAPDEDHALFPLAKRLHDYWRKRCGHEKSRFGPERFKEILPRLREHEDDAERLCLLAIDGAAFDPFISRRKNGSAHRHDEWHLIWHPDKFESFVNRAPFHKPKPEHLAAVSKAILWRHPDWDYERVTAEAKARVRRWAL